jgi:HemY protein
MAELEQRESGDEGRAREWMARALHARRDPAWTADGIVSDRWRPVSPSSHRLDAFEWKVPLAELADRHRVIEPDEGLPQASLPADPPAITPPPAAEEAVVSGADAERAAAKPAGAPLPAVRASAPARPQSVIPLVHVPDDPGPDGPLDLERPPEPPTPPRGVRLFK